jgi:hypothetical protein
MDEQRMALEDKISMLLQAQTKPKAKRKTSRKKSGKDDFRQAMADATQRDKSGGRSLSGHSGGRKLKKSSTASILKRPSFNT